MIKDCDSDTGEDSEAAGEFLIQKLSAVFVTKNLLNLAAMNVIIWILWILKFVKIRDFRNF